jgi:hypothetical protein
VNLARPTRLLFTLRYRLNMHRFLKGRGFQPPSPPPEGDPWGYQIVSSALALTVLTCVGGFVVLQLQGNPKAEAVILLGVSSLGILSGLLVASPAKR